METQEPPTESSSDLPVRIVVVDDHKFMRELICARLQREGGRYRVVGHAADAKGAVEQCRWHQPDLLILDINLPDKTGIEVVPQIRKFCEHTRVLLCTAYPVNERVDECLKAGAAGFVEKTNTWDDFLGAVERVSRGERYFVSKPAESKPVGHSGARQQIREPNAPLTTREKEILALVAEGLTSKDIARRLDLSVLTVDTHRANLMNKLGVRNVAGLVVFAVRSGIYEPAR